MSKNERMCEECAYIERESVATVECPCCEEFICRDCFKDHNRMNTRRLQKRKYQPKVIQE